MTTMADAPELSGAIQALSGALILLAPLAGAGLALMNTGLSRSRSAAHAMLAALCVVSVAALAYFAFGWSWQGFPGRPAHEIYIGGQPWNFIASEPFFFRGLALDGSRVSLAAWLQVFAVALAALIPLGAGGERWRLGAACASTALLAGWTYPLFAHWMWGGGWLAQLGATDAGGAGVIQAVGGLTAFSIARILGPRHGKYDASGLPAAFPGHNAVLVLLGCFFTWIGWIGLNGAGTLLMAGGTPADLVRVAMNTTFCAAAGLLATAGITRLRFGRPDASLCANGWNAGLVASSAACAWLSPVQAVMIGVAGGLLVIYCVEWLDAHWRVDDPAGAISVHGAGGILGLLAAGIFAHGARPNQGLAQLAAVAALLLVVLPMTYFLNSTLNRFLPQRVSPEGEPHGLDLHELGAGAYPEFVTRRDEYRPR